MLLIETNYSPNIFVVSNLVPVEIEENPANTTHFAGDTVSLNCSASGFPSAMFAWYKNRSRQPVLEDERVTIYTTTLVETCNETVTQSTLRLFNLSQSDDADYFCEARNQGANDLVSAVISSFVYLRVQCEY